ncbi:hypothetical protein [Spirosoma gilvum]
MTQDTQERRFCWLYVGEADKGVAQTENLAGQLSCFYAAGFV